MLQSVTWYGTPLRLRVGASWHVCLLPTGPPSFTGIMVGFTWEKSFESGIEAVADGCPPPPPSVPSSASDPLRVGVLGTALRRALALHMRGCLHSGPRAPAWPAAVHRGSACRVPSPGTGPGPPAYFGVGGAKKAQVPSRGRPTAGLCSPPEAPKLLLFGRFGGASKISIF